MYSKRCGRQVATMSWDCAQQVQKTRMVEDIFQDEGIEPTFVIQLLMHLRMGLL